jgi:hypothetical protein
VGKVGPAHLIRQTGFESTINPTGSGEELKIAPSLREVLRQLQSGDVEKGLRRAPIAVSDPDQPARVGTDARLGNRDPRYSLRDLIGSGGSVTAWFGGDAAPRRTPAHRREHGPR